MLPFVAIFPGRFQPHEEHHDFIGSAMRLKGTTVVTLATGFNLLLTLGNQVVLAYLFGVGTSMDAFLACGAVPFVVLNLAIGDLGYILIPLLLRYVDFREARRAIESTFAAVLTASVLLTAAGLLEHRTILHLTTAPAMPKATFELAASLAPMMWGIIGLTVLSSYLTGLHHYYRFFTAAAVTMALPYLGMILGGFMGAYGTGVKAVAWGWFAGTLARTALLYLTLPSPRPSLGPLRHPATRQLMQSLLPLGVALLPFAALPSIDVFWASRLPVGSISFLGYSTRIVIAIALIVVQGLSVVLFPDISEDAKSGRLDDVRRKSLHAIRFIFALIVPLASLVLLLGGPMLGAVLQHGRFTSSAMAGVLHVLPWYLVGTLPMAMMNIISRTYFALRDYRTPALTGLLALAIYIVLCRVLIIPYSYAGIGMAYAVFWTFLFLLQTALLGRRVGALLTTKYLRYTSEVLVCAAISFFAAKQVSHLLTRSSANLLLSTLVGSAFVSVYLVLCIRVLSIPEYRLMAETLQRITSRRLFKAEINADFIPGSFEPAILAGAQGRKQN